MNSSDEVPVIRCRATARAVHARYLAYQAQLAGHTVREIFARAAAFLKLAAANATSITDISAHAAR